jgi:hypothetical protein
MDSAIADRSRRNAAETLFRQEQFQKFWYGKILLFEAKNRHKVFSNPLLFTGRKEKRSSGGCSGLHRLRAKVLSCFFMAGDS